MSYYFYINILYDKYDGDFSIFVIMNLMLSCVLCYLLGSIPTGFILTKFCGNIDIRELGSHSTGATNVLRSGHKWLALITLLVDAIKGIICAIVSKKDKV